MKSSSSLVPTKSIEEQLEELEQLCDTAPVGLSLMDCDFRYLRLNKWLAEMNGKPVSAHMGRTIREVLPEIATSVEARLRRVIETGEPVLGVEMHGLTPAQPGVGRDWSISSYPVHSEKGEVRAIASVIEEVTERKQAEQALQKAHDELELRVVERTHQLEKVNVQLRTQVESRQRVEQSLREGEERLRKILETTRAIPWEADAESWQFTYVGPQAVGLLGYPVKEWYQKDFWSTHIHPDDRQAALEFCQSSSQSCQEYEFEYRMIASDGSAIWIHDLVTVDTVGGSPKTLRGFMMDITERKNSEEARIRAEKELRRHQEELAHVSRVATMAELASSLAHELNQPLAAILANAQSAQRFSVRGEPDRAELEETLQDLVGDASRAGGMIERQRRFLRKDQSDRSVLDINEVIQGVESLARTEALENRVTLVFDLAADSLTTWADRIQLEQVLLNLIRNGSEAMKSSSGENGELVVGTRLLETNTIIISICDSGPSLDRQSFDRIFEPFYTTKPNGLGMGLPICRSIVEAHGGRLWAVQSPEQGITVFFTLPCREGELSG